MKTDPRNSNNKIYTSILLISFIVVLFLFWWIYGKDPAEAQFSWISQLPALNASLNSVTAVLLLYGYRLIKNGNKHRHARVMISATFTSGLFLISYLTYHHYVGDTKFLGTGIIRPIYFFILISHIILSIVQIPGILLTLFFAFTQRHELHKRFAKVTFPIWLYVSVTGVIIFLFLEFLNQ